MLTNKLLTVLGTPTVNSPVKRECCARKVNSTKQTTQQPTKLQQYALLTVNVNK